MVGLGACSFGAYAGLVALSPCDCCGNGLLVLFVSFGMIPALYRDIPEVCNNPQHEQVQWRNYERERGTA